MITPAVRLIHAELEALTNPKRSPVTIAATWGLSGVERRFFLMDIALYRARVGARARNGKDAQDASCVQRRSCGTGPANSQERAALPGDAPCDRKGTWDMTPRQSLRVAAKVDRGAPSVQHPESSALAGGCQVTPPDLKCQVCDAPAIGVASSSLGPISFAYCAECGEWLKRESKRRGQDDLGGARESA